jgi:hypothetical protein
MIKLHFQLVFIAALSFMVASETPNPVTFDGFQAVSLNYSMKIQYEISEFELQQIDQDGKSYVKLNMGNAGSMSDPGEPYLPTVSTYYAVEPGKSFSVVVNVQETETIPNVDILPFESWEPNRTGKLVKGDSYVRNVHYPENIATVSDPIVMRGLTMVQVSVTPFQYNPVTEELTVIQSVEIELVEEGVVEMPFIPAKRSRAFEPLYESLVVNYASLSRDEIEYQQPAILYVLPSNLTTSMMNQVEELMDWKHRVGYEVNYVNSSNVVNNRNNLKNYIDDAYETWDNPPVHVTIIGDAEGSYDIPTWTDSWSSYNGEGDHPYSTLEGNDQFPDLFLGRLSFDTSSDLQTIIGKTLNYESSPYLGENWFQRACLVGDPSSSGISCIITNEHIHELLDIAGFEEVNTVYNSPWASQMQAGISEGVSFFNYRGYWGVSGFSSSNVNNTSNGFMLPVATVITCGTGSFGSGEALSESFIRAGTASNPKGSVACIGTATLGTHTMFNNIVDMGFYYGALVEGIESAGAALMYGKMMLYKSYPSNPSNYCHIFSHWNNLMGESSLSMWSAYPEQITVDHPYALSKGTNYIDITVAKASGALEEAWVTILMDDEIFESGYTNANGFIRLPIPSSQTGVALVTVTKKNHYPYQSSFQIYDPGVSVNVSESTLTIDDDNFGESVGDGNGTANGGETLEISISATNFGSEDAENVYGVIASESGYVTIQSATVNYGAIPSGNTVGAPIPYVITLAEGLPEGANLDLIIYFNNNGSSPSSGMLNVSVSGNNLFATSVDVIGSSSDILSPGESSHFKIELNNSGTMNASAVTGTITCASPFIEILDNTGTWSSVMSDGSSMNGSDYFEVFVSEETLPGAIVHFILNVETAQGYESNSIVEVQIGEPTITDPVGPDAHGYYIYDSGDIGYTLAPTYNWVEIDNRYGGSGSHLSSLNDSGNNNDDVETVNLPFTFKFYGQEYDQISICSNGWAAMGESTLQSFRNYQIPGVGGPSKMIAVFWDDLIVSSQGRVYTLYDEEEKRFYIQWSRVRTYQNNSTETFQLILLDPDYYITPTGDGEFMMQYMDFNNTSYTSGSTNHGNYCTIGTEDHTMTMGLQYTFNNLYHPAAMELSDGSSLLFTTRGSNIRLMGDLNYDEKVDIYDILLLVDYNLGYEDHVNPFFGDINSDGLVNVMDMVALIRVVLGYTNS